jgi:hypothetical protein
MKNEVIEIPKENVRRVNPDQVEILDGPSAEPQNPFAGMAAKNFKVITGGPLIFLAPLLIPLFLLLMLVLFVPLMIGFSLFGKTFVKRTFKVGPRL